MADGAPPELKAAIAAGRALIVCGAGVSMAATGGTAPSWAQLIEDGLALAEAQCAPDDKAWVEGARAYLKSKKNADWLRAADVIQERLGGPPGGPYRAFLKQRLATLKNTKPALLGAIERLAAAKNPIATTNYDHLISHALRHDRVDWTHHLGVVEALRGRNAVWHIHGDYDHPTSVVCSKSDYQRIADSEFLQLVQQSAALNFTLVFVGCSGSGLSDDNGGELPAWATSTLCWSTMATRTYGRPASRR